MSKYNHAYDIAFSLTSQLEGAEDVTPSDIRLAVLHRLASLDDAELLEAVNAPFDSYKEA